LWDDIQAVRLAEEKACTINCEWLAGKALTFGPKWGQLYFSNEIALADFASLATWKN
jgi:hypothetical protein